MKIRITIECETISELLQHLYVIIRSFKKVARREKYNVYHDEFKKMQFGDNNCYGEHLVKVTNTK